MCTFGALVMIIMAFAR